MQVDDSVGSGSGGSFEMLRRVIAVIEEVSLARVPLGVSALARTNQMPKSTAYRLLEALVTHDLLARQGRGYVLGDGTRRLARLVDHRLPMELRQLMVPFAVDLYERTGDMVIVGMLDRDELVILHEVRGHQHDRFTALPDRVPAHCCAAGKLLLAQRPDPVVFPRPLTACTPHTITDAAALIAELHAIRRHGVAYADEEQQIGLVEVAHPIFGRNGALAALSRLHSSSQPLDVDDDRSAHREIASAASAVARRSPRHPSPPRQPSALKP